MWEDLRVLQRCARPGRQCRGRARNGGQDRHGGRVDLAIIDINAPANVDISKKGSVTKP